MAAASEREREVVGPLRLELAQRGIVHLGVAVETARIRVVLARSVPRQADEVLGLHLLPRLRERRVARPRRGRRALLGGRVTAHARLEGHAREIAVRDERSI